MTQPPPSRYRVVEQGRRLVVIDTLTGAPATRPMPSFEAPTVDTAGLETMPDPATGASAVPERIAFDGRSTIVTRPFYDDKAPRTLTLDPGATALIEKGRNILIAAGVFYAVLVVAFPWLLVLPLVALNPRARAAVRQAATRWLDRYDTGSSAG